MTRKQGRPTFYKSKMIRRTYQITVYQDRAIKKIGAASGESDSSILRDCIDNMRISIINDTAITLKRML